MSGQEKNQQEPLKIVAPTLESIKSDHKDVFDEIYNMGASQERDRIKSVQSQLMPGYEEQIATMMFDGKSTDADAALMIVQGEKKSLEAAKNSIKNTQDPVPDAPAPHKKSKANLQGEELYKAEWEEDESLKASFIDFENYAAFRSAEDAGQVRVLGKS